MSWTRNQIAAIAFGAMVLASSGIDYVTRKERLVAEFPLGDKKVRVTEIRSLVSSHPQVFVDDKPVYLESSTGGRRIFNHKGISVEFDSLGGPYKVTPRAESYLVSNELQRASN